MKHTIFSLRQHEYGILLILGMITLLGLAIRLPYWQTIPASGDEVGQTVFAYQIAQGQMLPLVANDAYTGPFYVYFLAGLIRLGITQPMMGRAVVLLAGTLTIPVSYLWTVALSQNKPAGFLAALLVMTNPDLILLNSHLGGATYLLPFLTLLFLWLLTESRNRDSRILLIASAVAAGLAIQSNLVAGLAVAAAFLWFIWESRGLENLGKSWPIWPILASLVVVLIYSPVIIHNFSSELGTIADLSERSYLWESNPTVAKSLNNFQRLSMQTVRQNSSILRGHERSLLSTGFSAVYVVLLISGLVYTTVNVSILPFMVLIPYYLFMPIFSSHYGFEGIGRFTTLLISVWATCIGVVLANLIAKLKSEKSTSSGLAFGLTIALSFFLVLYPLFNLSRYYDFINNTNRSGRALLELSRYAAKNNNGEPVYISTLEELEFMTGLPYVPNTTFLLNDIHHEFLTPELILGKLYENPRPSFFLLSDNDAANLEQYVPLSKIPITANEEAGRREYSLYLFEADSPLEKPEFVVSNDSIILDNITAPANFGSIVRLIGCEQIPVSLSQSQLSISCYFGRVGEAPPATYVGFAHLINDTTTELVAQDDHVLGQERYPLNAWQSNEIVKEEYLFSLTDNLPDGDYSIRLGVYTWPDQKRLQIPGSQDDLSAFSLFGTGE